MQIDSLAKSLLVLSLFSTSAVATAQVRRALPNQVAAPPSAPVVASAPANQPIAFGLTLPVRNPAALAALVKAQQDPKSPLYRRYLSRAEFVARFGPTQADYDRVLNFAKAQGFTVTHTFANRMLVNVSGTPAQIDNAFAVHMKVYKSLTENRTYHAPDVEPTVEASVPILGVVGLSTEHMPKPMLVKAATIHADTTGSGPDGQFLGSDMRAAYAPNISLAGQGQTVGLIELGPYNLSDVQAYFAAVNQPLNVPIYNVLIGVDGICSGSPNDGGCDDGEEVIDMEQAISMAPGLSGLIIYEAYGDGGSALNAFSQAASDDVAKQLSLSFGFPGTPSTMPGYEQTFMELQAQGQNLFIASGDSGANVGGVGYPGNSPNVTDAGGTDLTTAGPGGPWASETAWVGSGGGWSTQSPIPAYQVPAINSSNQGSTQFRNIPDLSMEANTDNFFCANGSCQEGIGGTSLAAPRWAGFLALANQQADGNPIGFLNTTFYGLNGGGNYARIFHDIVEGNDFNASSPDMFSAVPGYDLTTGWGTPNGQAMLDLLAPASEVANQPNFTLTAAPATLPLTPGASASSGITLSGVNGFTGAVTLTATVIGSPTGVSATLGDTTLSAGGQTTLDVTTTAATPGGSYVVAVTGVAAGLQHTAYIKLALPDFALLAAPSTLYLDQNNKASTQIGVDALNGFDSPVTLSLSQLPPLVTGSIAPVVTSTTSTVTLAAQVAAPTTPGAPVTVAGTAGSTMRQVPSLTVAISAALGYFGLGTPVNLASSYNLTGIRTDGSSFTDGGLDGDGYAFSEALLTRNRVLNGMAFTLGAPNVPNAVFANGQTIALPQGHYQSLQLLANGINGNQADQAISVTYTDGTTQTYTQSFSDWYQPSTNVNEGEAVAMAYRNAANGMTDNRQFNLYGYTLLLQNGKTVQSVTLPKNRSVVILAATLTPLPFGTPVDLASQYNATGIYTDGSKFSGDGGLDGGGAAYSANLLNDPTGGETVAVGPSKFTLGGANVPDVVYGAGQTIRLPLGLFSQLKLLATAVQGDQTAQPVVVHYYDGSSQTFNQSFSDWSALSGYPHESVAVTTAYRDYNDGTQDQQAFNIYLYTLPLKPLRLVKSITLPNNRDVLVLSITLAPPSLIDLESLFSPTGQLLP